MTELVWALAGAKGAEGLAKRKSRSLSYKGCWTCRERHVKCDERPDACGTCERAGRACAGYGVRLIWPSVGHGNSPTLPRRRRLQHGGRDRWRIKDAEVVEAIAKAGRGHRPMPSTKSALFSVLSSSSSPPPSPVTAGPSQLKQSTEIDSVSRTDRESLPQTASPNCSTDVYYSDATVASPGATDTVSSRVDEVIGSPQSSWNSSAFRAPSQLSNPLSYLVASDFERGINDVSDSVHLSPNSSHSDDPNDVSAVTMNAAGPPLTLVSNNGAWSEVLDSPLERQCLPDTFHLPHDRLISLDQPLPLYFSGQAPAAILLRHYMENVVYLMQPVSHRSNLFKAIYLTTALEGSRDVTSPEISSAAVSVYHSVLAAAAIHLQWSSPQETNYLNQMACNHRQKALQAARSALDDKQCTYKAVMTAVLSLVSVDIMDGGINDHWIHLEAARSLQESRSRFRLLSRQTRQLNTICKMLRLFAQTVQAIPRFESSPVEYTGPDNLGLDDLEACIEFTYGITHFLANAIFKIFHLSQCLAHCHENAYPEALLDACEALGDELLSWKIESEPFSTIDATDERMLGVAKAQATAFYNATLIYYFRSIQRCERKELRAEQRATLEAMNLAEDLKSNSPQHHHWPAPITWPAFIASCEAEDGDRLGWSRWWARVQDYRMNNYLKQRGIVERIWQRIDDSDISIDWREILAEMDIMVIAV